MITEKVGMTVEGCSGLGECLDIESSNHRHYDGSRTEVPEDN